MSNPHDRQVGHVWGRSSEPPPASGSFDGTPQVSASKRPIPERNPRGDPSGHQTLAHWIRISDDALHGMPLDFCDGLQAAIIAPIAGGTMESTSNVEPSTAPSAYRLSFTVGYASLHPILWRFRVSWTEFNSLFKHSFVKSLSTFEPLLSAFPPLDDVK